MTEDSRMTQERVAHLASELETSRTECTSLRGERDATRFTLESVKSAAKDEVDALRDSLRSERGRVEEARTRLASVDALKARNSKLEERERVLPDQLRDALGNVMRFKERARDAASFAASMNGAFIFIFVRAIGLRRHVLFDSCSANFDDGCGVAGDARGWRDEVRAHRGRGRIGQGEEQRGGECASL